MDWGMVAAVVAIVTIPLYASPLLLAPAFNLVREYVIRILYRRAVCGRIRWQDLPSQQRLTVATSHHEWFRRSGVAGTPGVLGPGGSSNAQILNFFRYVWHTAPRVEERPRYLKLEGQYLGIDSNALIVALMLDDRAVSFIFSASAPHHVGKGSTSNIRYARGSPEGIFRYHETDGGDDAYILGRLHRFPLPPAVQNRFHGLSKDDLLHIAQGYPPFYRSTFKARSGVDVAHPVREERDATRAGWVVAIGFASDPPIRLYNNRFMPRYEEACRRVLHVLEHILVPAFKDHQGVGQTLRSAVRGVKNMNRDKTGSVLSRDIDIAVFGDGDDSDNIGVNLSARDIRLVLDLFNSYSRGELSDTERSDIETIVLEALKAAVKGVYTWWQYVNNQGHAIPEWLLDERTQLCPIWLED
ncbi:hypothetical protein GGS23DRAFT_446097 [Durotheca rogersii]|uniref:uncharacterized protein n=1 Tax=Durotheca rogersii TaxID=419775 RepID=UPI00221FC4D6|nr:uncharacterized protein GGS23DRAFT_446097 [Durotheca rogersii]KAI5855077.1 hypothetical protein GGS23DRAFT_446097 [Durotheca rogersii]